MEVARIRLCIAVVEVGPADGGLALVCTAD